LTARNLLSIADSISKSGIPAVTVLCFNQDLFSFLENTLTSSTKKHRVRLKRGT
jgi:hypothetical protein